MPTTKLKPTWWCDPDFLPGATLLGAEVRLESGELLFGAYLIPNNAERFVLEEVILDLEYGFELHRRKGEE